MSKYDDEVQGTYFPGKSVFWSMGVGQSHVMRGLACGAYPQHMEFICADAILGFKGQYRATLSQDRMLWVTRTR